MILANYILENGDPVVCVDLLKWGRWMETSPEKRVGEDFIGPYRISTVFLGLDHQFGDDGPPLLFETMIFVGGEFKSELDQWQDRCSTLKQAEEMHARAVELVKKEMA